MFIIIIIIMIIIIKYAFIVFISMHHMLIYRYADIIIYIITAYMLIYQMH